MSDKPIDIRRLKKSERYRVCQTFTDFYHNQFKEGEVLTFVEHHFLPYHGGHTVVFQERKLYLQEEENASILDGFGTYFSLVNDP
jgi:hypothetical protein